MNDKEKRSTAPDARELAYLSLLRTETRGRYSNLEAAAALGGAGAGLSAPDRALYTRLYYGAVERALTLEFLLRRLSPDREPQREVRLICMLGLYQLRYCDRIPPSAAVDTSVGLAKRHAPKASGYVNAVLRGYVRRSGELDADIAALPRFERLAVEYSLPEWLVRMWDEQYGSERALRIMHAAQSVPRAALRVNTLRTGARELAERLRGEGVESEAADVCGLDALLLSGGVNPASLAAFREGLCYVQDLASQLAVRALDAVPGCFALDLCSAPGGKAFGMAIDMRDTGRVVAADLHDNKLKLVSGGAVRLGLRCIGTACADARILRDDWAGKADRVLVDAPCSGLGVLAKKPDIRGKTPEQIAGLPEIQRQILRTAARYVRPGGILVYSTCTLNRAENEEIALSLLRDSGDFTEEPVCAPEGALRGEAGVTLAGLPGMDGFYIAKLRRRG